MDAGARAGTAARTRSATSTNANACLRQCCAMGPAVPWGKFVLTTLAVLLTARARTAAMTGVVESAGRALPAAMNAWMVFAHSLPATVRNAAVTLAKGPAVCAMRRTTKAARGEAASVSTRNAWMLAATRMRLALMVPAASRPVKARTVETTSAVGGAGSVPGFARTDYVACRIATGRSVEVTAAGHYVDRNATTVLAALMMHAAKVPACLMSSPGVSSTTSALWMGPTGPAVSAGGVLQALQRWSGLRRATA